MNAPELSQQHYILHERGGRGHCRTIHAANDDEATASARELLRERASEAILYHCDKSRERPIRLIGTDLG